MFVLSASADSIVNVLVRGNIHVSDSEILEVVQTRAGDDMTSRSTAIRIRDDFRAIYALGYFKDIVVKREPTAGGWNLVWEVLEKPLIADIEYEGNKKYKKKKLNEEIAFDSTSRFFFDQSFAQTYQQKLKDYYTKKSYPNTKISWKTRPGDEENTVILVYSIQEGSRLPIKKIRFVGNQIIPDKALKKTIQTKESFWFIIKHEYDDAKAQEDLQRIKQIAYGDIGYLDASATIASVSEENNGLTITFAIEEGDPYVLGNVSLTGNTIFSDAELLSHLSLRPGDLFSFGTLIQDRVNMQNVYRGQGFLDASINFDLQKDKKNHVANLNLTVVESDRKHLGKVEIQGGITLEDGSWVPTQEGEFRTKDFVIEREIELKEGGPLDWTQVIESDRNLVNLDFFRIKGLPIPGQTNLYPGFQRVPTSDPTVENLLLRLEEKETGLLTFGGGVSTAFGPSVFVTVSEKNLFGYGIRGSITGEVGELRNRLALNIFEPHLFNTEYSADWDIYYIDQEGFGGRRFNEQRTGSSLMFGKELIPDELALLFGIKGEVTDLSADVGRIYSIDPTSIPNEFNLGENTTTSLTFGYYYDTRDFKIDPRSGIYSRSTIELAGLTDNEFVKWENLVNYYMPVLDRLVLALSGEFNLGYAYGDPGFIPLQERFFVGGANSIRGFDEGGIGRSAVLRFKEIDGGYRTYLGGESSFVGNMELRYPITEMFQVVSFFDMGTVWDKIADIDPSEFRFSTGAGMRIKIPGLNALIRFDLGFPIRKFDEDDTEFFHFSFGQSF